MGEEIKRNEPKSLRVLQVFSVIGYVVSIVVFVLAIIGCISSITGGITLLTCKDNVYNNKTLAEWILESSNKLITVYTLALLCFNGAICTAGAIATSMIAIRYFRNTMKSGNPFTHSGAKELFRLGIIELSVTVGCAIITLIVFGIFVGVFGSNNVRYIYLEYIGPALGLIFLVFSCVFRYGADLREPIDNK